MIPARYDIALTACSRCGYVLDGLPSDTCPECGRVFDPNDSGTFDRLAAAQTALFVAPAAEAARIIERLRECEIRVLVGTQSTDDAIEHDRSVIAVARDDLPDALAVALEMFDGCAGERSWDCPDCGDAVPPYLAVCWSCGSAIPTAREPSPLLSTQRPPTSRRKRQREPRIPVSFGERLLLYTAMFFIAGAVAQLWMLVVPLAFFGAAMAVAGFLTVRIWKNAHRDPE